ncbi:MAG: DUF2085 domain-containing protein [Candidatus Heimdallarchaeota archaeon]|nr:MAG: DUF2085 domain-containing protein [Candidatus Heimdallarchaeota archaeon]
MKLSLAHHPICGQFRSHTFSVGGLFLCLGCTGFYSGVLIGGLIILIVRAFQLDWFTLVCISAAMFLPTIFRLMKIPVFSSEDKYIRFLFRLLLGAGVAFGLTSIVKAPHVLIGLIQLILGVGLYLGIGINRIRSKNMWLECQDCTYTLSTECPGLTHFHLRKDS